MKNRIISLFVMIMVVFTTSCVFYSRNTFTEMESIEYIKEYEEYNKTLTTIFQVKQDFQYAQSKGLYLTYGYTDFYENHFISYKYAIFNLHNLDERTLVSMKIGRYKEDGNNIIMKYTRNYDFDFKYFYPIDYKENLSFYSHYVYTNHYIENTYGDIKITITFTTPEDVLTDNDEISYFQIADLKVKVADGRVMD